MEAGGQEGTGVEDVREDLDDKRWDRSEGGKEGEMEEWDLVEGILP